MTFFSNRKAIIVFIVLTILSLSFTSCLDLFDFGDPPIPRINIEEVNLQEGTLIGGYKVGYWYEFWWKTAESSVSTLYRYQLPEGEDADSIGLDTITWEEIEWEEVGIGNISLPEDHDDFVNTANHIDLPDDIDRDDNRYRYLRNLNVPFLPEAKYIIGIRSIVDTGSDTYEGIYIKRDRLVEVSTAEPQNGVIFKFDYAQDDHYADNGDFIAGVWAPDNSGQFDFTQEPAFSRDIPYDEYVSDQEYTLLALPHNNYRFRVWRDYDGNGLYNQLTDPSHPTTYQVSVENGVDYRLVDDVGSILLEDPQEYPSGGIEITSDLTDTIKPNTLFPVDITIDNQWNNPYTENITVTFSSTDTNEATIDAGQNGNYVFTEGNPVWTHEVSLALTPTSVENVTRIRSTIEYTSISGNTVELFDETDPISIDDSHIDLEITYNPNGRYSGDYIIIVYEDGLLVDNILINDADFDFPHYEKIPTQVGSDYIIEVFRDYDGGNIGSYDADTDAFGNGSVSITTNNQQPPLTINLVEPAIIEGNINITNQDKTDITSGEIITLDLELLDQWDYLYSEDAFYSIIEQEIDFTSTNADIDLEIDGGSIIGGTYIDVDTVIDDDKDGLVTVGIRLKRIPNNLLNNINTSINASWSGVTPPLTSASNPIVIRCNYIEGTFTYNNDGLQTGGDLVVEVWNTDIFTDSGSPNRLRTIDSQTYDPNTLNGFTVGTFPIVSGEYDYTFKVQVRDSFADYYIRVFRDFGDNGYDTSNTNDVNRDAYRAYPTIPISVDHNNPAVVFTDKLINKTEILEDITAELNPAVDVEIIREVDTVDIDIMFENQWGNQFTGTTGSRTVDIGTTNANTEIDTINGSPTNQITVSTNSVTIVVSLDKTSATPSSAEITQITLTDNSVMPPSTGTTGNFMTLHDSSITFDVNYTGAQPTTNSTFLLKLDDGSVIDISEAFTGSTFPYTSITYYLPYGAYDLKAFLDFNGANAYYDGNPVTMNFDTIDNDIEANHTDTSLTINNAQHNTESFLLSDTHPKDIQYITLTGAPTVPTTVKSGDATQSIPFDVNTFDQWGQAYGDNTENIRFYWNGNTSPADDNVIINGDTTPPYIISIDGSGITSADLIMENITPTNDTNTGSIDMNYSANTNVNVSIADITVDGEKPTITIINPADGSTQYTDNFDIVLNFSEAMNTGTVVLSGNMSGEVGATSWSAGDTVLTISPATVWAEGTNRQLIVDGEDLVGNAMLSVTIDYYIDYTNATVTNINPPDGSDMTTDTFDIVFTFSEDMDIASGILSGVGMGPEGTLSWDDPTHLRVSPTTSWSEGINRELRIQSLNDASLNPLPADVVAYYTIDVTAPVQQSAEVQAVGDEIIITFNENLDPTAPDEGNLLVTTTQGFPVTVLSTSVSGTDLTLNLDRVIEDTETGVSITYDKDAGTPKIKDEIFGNITNNFVMAASNSSNQTPQVSISAPASNVTEGNNMVYPVSLDFASSYDVTVTYSISGANITAGDYDDSIDGGDIVIGSGSNSGSITIGILDDSLYEGGTNETITVTITSITVNGTSTGNIGTANANGTIVDAQSLPTVNITGVTTNSINEDDAMGTVDVTVSITPTPHYSNVDVVFDITGSSATGGGSDYTLNNVTILANQPNATATITITDDLIYEGNETIVLSIDSVTAAAGTDPNVGVSTETITIVEDDPASIVEFASASSTPNENVGNATVNLTITPAFNQIITATIEIIGGTATEGAGGNWDYTFSTPVNVNIPANTSNHSISIPINSDNVYEGIETFQLEITALTGGFAIGGQATHTVSILDDEAAPTVSYEPDKSVNEDVGGGTVDVALNISPLFDTDTTVTIGTSGGTATGGGTDYDIVSTSLLIPAYTSSVNATLNINDDDFYEGDETVVLDLISATGGVNVSGADHTLTINENENIPEVYFTVGTGSVNEDVASGIKTVSVSMDEKYYQNLTISFTVSGGSATGSGTDFTMPGAGSVSIPAGSTSTTFDITIIDDGIYEPAETIELTINNPAGDPTANPGTYTLTILNDEAVPEVSFANLTSSIAEDGGSQTLSLDINPPYYQDTDVSFSVIGAGTTASGSDYGLPATVTIPAENNGTTFNITINDDTSYESDETLTISINNPSGDPTAHADDHVLTILDDETAPVASFTSLSNTVVEGSGVTTATVELDGLYGYPTTITYTLGGDSSSGTDYDLTPATFTIPANTLTADFTIDVLDDLVYEEDETLTITLTGTDNDTTIDGANDVFTLTITDDEAAPIASFTSLSNTVAEGSGNTTATVQLNREYDQITTISYTVGGDATGGTDYNLTPATFTIPANTLTADFTIDVLDDINYELAETVTITLDSTSNDTTIDGANDVFTLTINPDGDTIPTVNIATPVSITEPVGSSTTLSVDVTLDRTSYEDIIVDYTFTDVTATGGNGANTVQHDYNDTAGTITIPAGSTGPVTVDVEIFDNSGADAMSEDFEITISLNVASGSANLGTTVSTATINQ